jgi:hypothetical protein
MPNITFSATAWIRAVRERAGMLSGVPPVLMPGRLLAMGGQRH